ncbi:assimilatory sulfite reductase (NADPH) flavoprotein subunit [Halobacillus litoralis]|uniref:assimilatory sulfite reductase (NADPH) n=1 Tax=Halobacillus litoralis TaxID=45668 RepID=A0A845DNS0_9BACI|nr:assimilatory sulfite reductase (NADPH) flavoprotein subunit [Halobacillus litoralis]MYL19150.1 assimilatory sulfite reductase (NADPH) flavoprotein subunit [Halobacillus litoralis]MYL37772.1 assimilatory sulfite reductase (NADPH) flavoprotein subunit [Halobacillus litoralis]
MSLQVINSPFNKEQTELLNQLLPTLNEQQKIWLSGYLAAGTDSGSGAAQEIEAEETAVKTRHVTLLYGSHTGNCQALAEDFSGRLKENGLQVSVEDMDRYKPKSLKKEEDLLIITSTHGDGDPPDNALSFYEFLYSRRAPKLDGVRYSVLALGDSSYEYFCQTGKDFDKRLEELGAERFVERVDCDLDYEEEAEDWINKVVHSLGTAAEEKKGKTAPSPQAAGPVYTKKNPFSAEVLENINLNGRGSNKETRHLELDLEDSSLEYEPGDSLGIYPINEEKLVDQLITLMQWDPELSVTLNKDGEVRALREALLSHFEITVLTKPLIEKLEPFTSNEKLQEILASKETLQTYIEGRDLLDLLADFGPWELGAEELIQQLRKIPPRLYSIASSRKANPDEVHLTIGTVRYESHGRPRLGVCSGQCAERMEPGGNVSVFVQKNSNFKLPEDGSAPVIMVGAGTGIAPYRAFLEEREELGAEGNTWLFFGEQHFTTDFLYQTEWQRWLKDGVLSRMDVAFSRDNEEKVYVQHRMTERSRELFEWLEAGAYLYVCGDEKHMAKDVHQALVSIVQRESGRSLEEAEAYVADLRQQKRYQRDVY